MFIAIVKSETKIHDQFMKLKIQLVIIIRISVFKEAIS